MLLRDLMWRDLVEPNLLESAYSHCWHCTPISCLETILQVQKSIGLPMGAQEPQVCRSGWEEDVSDERHCFEDEYERKLTAASRVGAIERYFFVLESSRRFCRASDLQSLTE
jgi:hypothetical protein